MSRVVRVESTANLYEGMKELLCTLQDNVLTQILFTTTKGYVTAADRNESISKIMQFSDAPNLLNRDKLTKKMLLDYLDKKGEKINCRVPKMDICRRILVLWGATLVENLETDYEDTDFED